MGRLMRVVLVGVVACGALGYGAIANQAKASSTINLQMHMTIHCNWEAENTGTFQWRTCVYTGATLDGTFVGTYVPLFGSGGPCNETWSLWDGADGLWGDMTCPGSPPLYASVNPSISVTGGAGRFAGYTAPPTPQPTFVYGDAYVPYVGVTIPATPVRGETDVAVCNSGGPGFGPQIVCPETGNGSGLVSLTLTGP